MLEPFALGSDMIKFCGSACVMPNLRPFKIWLPSWDIGLISMSSSLRNGIFAGHK